jgi:MoaA/NifB/PqqE/SkfB family radical SAM enzyme
MACPFCGAEEQFSPMDYGQALRLLRQLREGGVSSVVLGGGEPFLWIHDLRALAGEARRMGMTVQVGTNGLRVSRDAETMDSFDRWVLPLESIRPRVHDALRPAKDSHLLAVLDLLEDLRSREAEVTISSLVTAENFDCLVEVGDFLRDYRNQGGRLHAWHLYRFLPVGRGGSVHGERFGTKPELFGQLGELLKSRFPEMTIYLRPDMYHSRTVSFHWNQGGELKRQGAAEAAALLLAAQAL